MTKPNLLFYRDWSEVSPKGTHMHILSLFASDLKKGKYFQANVCISAALHWTVTFISNYSAKGLSITWSLLPHVYKCMLAASCWVTVNWSTALPHGAGRVTVATAPAVAAARTKPIKCRHSAWSGTEVAITVWGNREDGSSAEEELVGLHQKTASGLTSQAAGNPAKQQKLLLVLKPFISHHKYKRSTQAGICSNALSKHCAVHPAVSNRLWQCHTGGVMLPGWQSLLLTPLGILKTCSLWNLIVIYDYNLLYTFLIDPPQKRFNS